ncbi:MAG: ABC transporter permease [Candidatus Bipolaricaulota bacterium]
MIPKLIPENLIGGWADAVINWLLINAGAFFDAIAYAAGVAVFAVEDFWLIIPPIVVIIVTAAVGVYRTKSKYVGLFIMAGLYLVYTMGLWEPLMQTVSLITLSVLISVAIGVPVGIIASRSNLAWNIIKPILDLMQTMHPFVYLIPVVFLFGLGMVPGLLTTIIFATPPSIRLTNLGIRQVEAQYVEAGEAFGSTTFQLLRRVEIPLAMPSIMQGVNQSIMLSLSMVIIASMIAAGGLGDEIMIAIQRLNIGRGIQAGLAVVVLAITLDRISTAGQSDIS